jgi:hypothetical protein
VEFIREGHPSFVSRIPDCEPIAEGAVAVVERLARFLALGAGASKGDHWRSSAGHRKLGEAIVTLLGTAYRGLERGHRAA